MKHVQLLSGAQFDLAEAVAFYRARDERIAALFVAAVAHERRHPKYWSRR